MLSCFWLLPVGGYLSSEVNAVRRGLCYAGLKLCKAHSMAAPVLPTLYKRTTYFAYTESLCSEVTVENMLSRLSRFSSVPTPINAGPQRIASISCVYNTALEHRPSKAPN